MSAPAAMRFSVDPWDPSYGAGLDDDGDLAASGARVVSDVELPDRRWRPLDPDPAAVAPAATLFVDGVRRIDAQVWVSGADGAAGLGAYPALCASYAVGVVCCCAPDGAHLAAVEVHRDLLTGAPDASDVETVAGTYRATAAAPRPGLAPAQALGLALQARLAAAELTAALAARSGTGGRDDLLVVDGPLRGRQHLPRALGFVKTHRTAYLPEHLGGAVAALGAGQRTPVVLLGTSWDRYTWYLRLPGRPGAPWAGVVRLECSAGLPRADAVALAALSQVTLVRYASAEYKDPRAPQNLYPIAGLERALRRRLGERELLYRALRRAATG
jgi:hypothetical protein